MLQVCENEISLHKWPGGTAQLRTLEGRLACATAYRVGEIYYLIRSVSGRQYCLILGCEGFPSDRQLRIYKDLYQHIT